jgi:hypothetical protein
MIDNEQIVAFILDWCSRNAPDRVKVWRDTHAAFPGMSNNEWIAARAAAAKRLRAEGEALLAEARRLEEEGKPRLVTTKEGR